MYTYFIAYLVRAGNDFTFGETVVELPCPVNRKEDLHDIKVRVVRELAKGGRKVRPNNVNLTAVTHLHSRPSGAP